ncbi:InlB B-repeat-containing protein [Pontibacter sp. MBLB2868]|uniref:InlB B-repeat-containing protein n=1 Tax=Pontibacter sp. MBLB2868 TaxID=3451555 RepID=UPI003F7559A7
MTHIYFAKAPQKWCLKSLCRLALLALLIVLPFIGNAQWTRKSDALKKRAECPSILYNNKIYVFGGFGEHPAFETTNEVYDPAQNVWTFIASFPVGKEVTHQGVTVVDDKVWHLGGRLQNADGPVTSQVLIYDITNNTWSDGPELTDPATGQPVAIGGGGAALIGRTIHVFGGFDASLCTDQSTYHLTIDVDKWMADPQHTNWENKLAPMPVPRNHLSTAVLGGKIYALGGQFEHDCSGIDQAYCHVYNPITDSWTRLTDLPGVRSHTEGGTFATDGKIYYLGGQGPSGAAQNTVLQLDPVANNGLGAWAELSQYKLPNYYYGISSKIVNNLFVFSHGALKSITNEKIATYTSPVTRNIRYKLGFTEPCENKTMTAAQQVVIKNLLYTIEGTTPYSLSSSAPWLKITKNATGVATPTAIEIEATVDASTLAPGSYTATITATGTGGSPSFAGSSFCVNLQLISENNTRSLTISINGNGTVTKNPDQASYPAGTAVTLTATPDAGYQFAGWSGDATGTANPLSVTLDTDKNIVASFTQAPKPTELISNISATSNRSYQAGVLDVGVPEYTDRTYLVSTVPANLVGTPYIRTANDDKFNTSSTLLTFSISQPATIYIAYDPRATALPAWMNGWQKMTERIGVNDSKISYMELYSKAFPAGTVTLGGNYQSPAAGAENNYFVIMQADPVQQTNYTLTVNTSGSGTVVKSPDQASYAKGSQVTLTATPASGYEFSGWSGDASGTTNPLTVTMNSNKTVTATFSAVSTAPGLLLFTPTSLTANVPVGQQKELKVNLNNSDEDPVTVQLTATETGGTAVPAWLLYNSKTLSSANAAQFALGSSGNEVLLTVDAASLAAGTYTATVTASAAGYTSAELLITLEVASYEESLRPYVTAVRPADGEISVSLSQSVSVDVAYPSGQSLNGNTVNTTSVKLFKISGNQKTEVAGTAVNATAAGDAITLSATLDLNTTYEFFISDLVQDGNGYKMIPFTSRFTTVSSTGDTPTDLSGVAFTEQILVDNNFGSDGFTTLVIGPDGKLYAATSGGKIERWDIKTDGTLANHITISPFGANRRLLIGMRFDPSATASNLVAWISHSSPEFTNVPDWSGKVSRINLNTPNNPQVTDYVINLPRSYKDHATNGIDFGPDGALYFLQGSNTAMGAPDGAWGNRPERLLSAAVLRLDIAKAQQQSLPINAKTEDGGTYNPAAANAPLTIYATGIRNAYDLVWHTNGQLYVPANGSAAGGNTPALMSGTVWSNGQVYTGPDIPAMNDVRDTQSDYLFRVEKGGYYGHPNVLRHEYILNGGNPSAGTDPGEVVWSASGKTYGYPVGTPTEPNYRGWSYDFGLNKSPNGVIEYKSNAFNGKLKGKILVCRFSGGDDIMVLEPGSVNPDIIRATEGSNVPGLRRPFANPLDVTEDVRNGNLYISEYFDGNGDGQPRITLLRASDTNTPPPPPPTTVARLINAGGAQYTDTQSRTWSADAGFTGGVTAVKSFDVIGTTDDALYLAYRFASSGAPFSYNIPLSNGSYTVKLHFVEPYFGAPGGRAGGSGKRVFNVAMENQQVLSNFDIYALAGAATAVVKTFEGVGVQDGVLNINLTSLKDNAIISAIEILQPASSTSYTLAISTTGNGTVARNPDQESYVAGTQVTLTASPASGYSFAGWGGSASGTDNPLVLTMDANKTVTANFIAQQTFTLTATAGTEGAVTVDPQKASYAAGETVTITATPAAGYTFSGWNGDASGTANPITLTMNSDKTISAGFTAVQQNSYTITVTTNGQGTVTKTPDMTSYTPGTEVSLSASPASGYEFSGWGGDVSGNQNPLLLTMDVDKNVTANFTAVVVPPSTVRINAGGVAKTVAGVAWTNCETTANCSGFVSGGNPYFKTIPTLDPIPPYIDKEILETAWTNTLDRNPKKNALAFSYNIPVNNGEYLVKLYFVETEKTAAGQREFDVNIESGKKELQRFDIFLAAGQANKLVVQPIPATIIDGNVTIDFTYWVDAPIISAIEIVPANGATVAASIITGLASGNGEDGNAMRIRVYPNPNTKEKGNAVLENFGHHELVKISVYSTTGQLMYETTTQTNDQGEAATEIDTGKQLSRGVYIIRASSESGTSQTKLVIE